MEGKILDEHQTLLPVTSQSTFDGYITTLSPSTLLVLYFAAPWAAPCEQMSTVISTLAGTYPASDPPRAVFLSVNTDDLPDIAEQYDVTAVPFIVLSKNKKVLQTISGGDAATVRASVEKYAGGGGNSSTQIPPPQQVVRSEQLQPSPDAAVSNGAKNISGYTASENIPNGSAPTQKNTDDSTNQLLHEDDLNTRLSKLVKAAPVMLFMKGTPSAPQCGFSRQLVSTLRQNNVRYGFFNILADEEVRQGLKKFSDWPTFPQLYLDGELVGGLDIIKEELENDPSFLAKYSVDTSKNAGATVSAT